MGFHLSRVKQQLLANALAFDVQEFADIKQGSHKSYEYCRSLGMSTGLVGIGGLRATEYAREEKTGWCAKYIAHPLTRVHETTLVVRT